MLFFKKLKNDRYMQFFILILILAISLRLYNIGTQPLYVDEAWSYYAGDDLNGAVLKTLNYEEHPPLFNIISFFWRSIGFGLNEFTLRLLPALCGIISIFFLYLLAKEMFDKRVALISCLIMALSSEHIRMSQEYRPYELLVLFILAGTYFFVKSLRTNDKKYWFLYVLFMVLSGYTDHFSVFVMISLFIYFIIFIKKYRSKTLSFIYSEIVLSILLIPDIFIGLSQLDFLNHMLVNVSQNIYWKFLILPYNFYVFLLGSNAPYLSGFYINMHLIIPLILILSFFAYLIIKGLIYIIKKQKEKTIFLLLYLILPIFILYLVSFFTYMQLEPKRFLFITFPLYIFIALGINSIKNKKIFYLSILFVILISLFSITSYYNTEKERFDLVSKYITSNSEPDDVIFISMNMLKLPFSYYYNGDLQVYGLPYEYIKPEDYSSFKRNLGNLFISSDNFKETIFRNTQDKKRIWFIQSRDKILDKNKYIINFFNKNYKLISLNYFSNNQTKLYLYEIK